MDGPDNPTPHPVPRFALRKANLYSRSADGLRPWMGPDNPTLHVAELLPFKHQLLYAFIPNPSCSPRIATPGIS